MLGVDFGILEGLEEVWLVRFEELEVGYLKNFWKRMWKIVMCPRVSRKVEYKTQLGKSQFHEYFARPNTLL